MDSTITTLSPAFTLCPTDATIFTTFPGTAAETLTEPAPVAGAAAFGAAAGAAFGAGAAAFGAAAATGAAAFPFSSTVTSYADPLTVIV